MVACSQYRKFLPRRYGLGATTAPRALKSIVGNEPVRHLRVCRHNRCCRGFARMAGFAAMMRWSALTSVRGFQNPLKKSD